MRAHSYLPSRLFGVFILVVLSVGLVGGLFYLYTRNDAPPATPGASLAARPETHLATAATTLDTDKDGLADWEEVLWKTSPTNPDTDGDGLGDGDEVAENRDPTVAGPGNLGVQRASTTLDSYGAATNTTEYLARELFGSYLALKQAHTLDGAKKEALLAELTQRAESTLVPPSHTLDELAQVSPSTESYRAYRDALRGVFSPLSVFKNHELILAGLVMEQKDEQAKEELDRMVDAQKTLLEVLPTIPVPSDLVHAHLDLINGLEEVVYALEAYSQPAVDPIRTAASAGIYAVGEKAVTQAKNAIDAALLAQNL